MDWQTWSTFAQERRAAGASDATIMRELTQRGASADDAEGVLRELGATFSLEPRDAAAVATARSNTRVMLGVEVVCFAAGIGWLVLDGGGFDPADGGLCFAGLMLMGKALNDGAL